MFILPFFNIHFTKFLLNGKFYVLDHCDISSPSTI